MTIEKMVLENMPASLSPLEQARYMYLKLGTIVNFSTKYQNTTTYEMQMLYKSDANFKTQKSNQVVCSTWARIYADLLKSVGIEAVVNSELRHAYVLFKIGNRVWKADATTGGLTDLGCIKYGLKTSYFSPTFATDINVKAAYNNPLLEDVKLMDEIDSKFDFYNQRQIKQQKVEEQLKAIRESNLSVKEKMDAMFKVLGVLDSGYYEASAYVKSMETLALTDKEYACVRGTQLKRTNKDREVDIIQCLSVRNGDGYSYYIVAPNSEVKEVTKEDVLNLREIGFAASENNIPGIDYNIIFEEGMISKKNFKLNFFKKGYEDIVEYDRRQIRKI